MADLSAPTISEPIYDCAGLVIVTGYVPGAMINIHAQPPGPGSAVRGGGGVSNSASGQAFGVAAASMVTGATLTATQTFGGNTGPSSAVVTVQTPLSVDPPKAYLVAFFRRYLDGVAELDDYLSGVRQIEELEAFSITAAAQL